jgi:hypothetical protein
MSLEIKRRFGPGRFTCDANSGQRLQSYQSYLQTQYFNNIKPGANLGGWIDGGWDVERYAEQIWNTFFANVPEITLFNSMQISAPIDTGNRRSQDTNATRKLVGLNIVLPQMRQFENEAI